MSLLANPIFPLPTHQATLTFIIQMIPNSVDPFTNCILLTKNDDSNNLCNNEANEKVDYDSKNANIQIFIPNTTLMTNNNVNAAMLPLPSSQQLWSKTDPSLLPIGDSPANLWKKWGKGSTHTSLTWWSWGCEKYTHGYWQLIW